MKKPIFRLIFYIICPKSFGLFVNGGADQIRTGDQGVADLRLSHLATAP